MVKYHEMHRYLIITITLLLVGCTADDMPPVDDTSSERTTSIAQLREQIGSIGGSIVNGDVIVMGRVTSSDKDGNFFRSLIVEDESGAMELRIKSYDLATLYPEGLEVVLHLDGCAIGYDMGILQVGAMSEEYDYYGVDYIETPQRINRVIRRTKDIEPIIPRRCSIAEISRDDCGRLVRIDNLSLRHSTSIDTLQGMTLDNATWQGYALFFDDKGDSIAVYTAPEARFAKQRITTSELSITGILQWCKYDGGEECPHLKMRYATDYEQM